MGYGKRSRVLLPLSVSAPHPRRQRGIHLVQREEGDRPPFHANGRTTPTPVDGLCLTSSFRAAALVYVAFVLFIVYIDQFEFPWFGGYLNIVGISVIHVFFGALIARLMHGQRKDPYQTHEDRDRQIELGVKSLVWVGMAATIFVSLEIGLHALEMQSLSPTTTCLYLQLSGTRVLPGVPDSERGFRRLSSRSSSQLDHRILQSYCDRTNPQRRRSTKAHV